MNVSSKVSNAPLITSCQNLLGRGIAVKSAANQSTPQSRAMAHKSMKEEIVMSKHKVKTCSGVLVVKYAFMRLIARPANQPAIYSISRFTAFVNTISKFIAENFFLRVLLRRPQTKSRHSPHMPRPRTAVFRAYITTKQVPRRKAPI